MLKALVNNEIGNRWRRVSVAGYVIKVTNIFASRPWRRFNKPEQAWCAMAHVWSKCHDAGGMTFAEIAREIDDWKGG